MRLLIVSKEKNIESYVEFVEALDLLGVDAICVPDVEYCSLGKFKPLHVIPFPRLLKLVKRFNPDFVLTDSPYPIPHMAKLVNQRVLHHIRGWWYETDWESIMRPSFFVRMYNHYLARISKRGIRKIDFVLPNSKWLEKSVKRLFPNHPIHVLYVGINTEKWVPRHNTTFNVKHPAVVGIFSFGVHAKVLGLLKFVRVIRKMPDVNFYFAGKGAHYNLIKQNCPSNMSLIGRTSRSEVKKLLESCDIFVHPSGSDSLPRSVKEASLMAKPIIASNVGGIPEIVKNNETGYLCKIDDVDQWVEKIRFLLDNSDVALKFGENARNFVMETFDWKKIAENFLENLRAFKE